MAQLREVPLLDSTLAAFSTFLNETPILLAGAKDGFNAMTIGWGMLGSLWNKYTAAVYVRPCRYTYEYMMRHDFFSICVLPDAFDEQIALLGSRSGRDFDKTSISGLTAAFGEAPYYEQSSHVIILKKLYAQSFRPEFFTGGGLPDFKHIYRSGSKPGSDLLHTQFIGEVIKLLENRC